MTTDRDLHLNMLRLMLRIRRFEEKLAWLFKRGKLPGFVHLYIGEEAIAVGACSALSTGDRITSTHRGHGHLIAKGADVSRMMAELFGRRDGYCQGKGGSMHIVDFSLGIIGTNGIVGGGIPIAVGSAFGDQYLGRSAVTVAFFGDGAANQGVFFESMNLAAIWKLPMIFMCENNQYTEWTPTAKLLAGDIADRGKPFGIASDRVDGNDVLDVHAAATRAVSRARLGQGPTLIEATTYRWHGHNEGEEAFTGRYRPDAEIATWKSRDPIERLVKHLTDAGMVDESAVAKLNREEAERVDRAVSFAETSPEPDPESALTGLFSEPSWVRP